MDAAPDRGMCAGRLAHRRLMEGAHDDGWPHRDVPWAVTQPEDSMNRACALVLVLSLSTTLSFAQQLERAPPPAGEPRPQAYLAAEPLDYRVVLGLPPAIGSMEDNADR